MKLRCLQLTKFYPPYSGGIETTVQYIANGLYDRGWSVDVLCSNTSNTTIHERENISLIRTASIAHIASTSLSPMLVYWLFVLQRKSDIIHVHLPNPMANLALWLTRPKCKLILHWHSDIVKQKILLKIYRPLQTWLLNRSDSIIVTTENYAKSSIFLQPYLNKVSIVPSCTKDPLKLSTPLDRKFSAQTVKNRWPNKRIIFALGRMTYYKGFDDLINAASFLPDDVVILIGGTGELLNSNKELVKRLGLDHKVFFLGRIPDGELSGYFAASYLFCLPSLVRAEAFGLVLVEAMAHSVPIVATNIDGSGVPWVNQHGVSGLNATPGDVDSLVKCLLKLLNNPAFATQLGLRGRHRYESMFTLPTMIEKIIVLYSKILS